MRDEFYELVLIFELKKRGFDIIDIICLRFGNNTNSFNMDYFIKFKYRGVVLYLHLNLINHFNNIDTIEGDIMDFIQSLDYNFTSNTKSFFLIVKRLFISKSSFYERNQKIFDYSYYEENKNLLSRRYSCLYELIVDFDNIDIPLYLPDLIY